MPIYKENQDFELYNLDILFPSFIFICNFHFDDNFNSIHSKRIV